MIRSNEALVNKMNSEFNSRKKTIRKRSCYSSSTWEMRFDKQRRVKREVSWRTQKSDVKGSEDKGLKMGGGREASSSLLE